MDYPRINMRNLFISDITIQRERNKRDNYGGIESEYVTVEKTKGRISTLGTSISNRFNTQQDIGDIRYRLFLLPDTDIRRTDRVIAEGKSFYVADVKEPSYKKDQPHHLQAHLIEVQPDFVLKVEIENFTSLIATLSVTVADQIISKIISASNITALLTEIRNFITDIINETNFNARLNLIIPIDSQIQNEIFSSGDLKIIRFISSVNDIDSRLEADLKLFKNIISQMSNEAFIISNISLEKTLISIILNDTILDNSLSLYKNLKEEILNSTDLDNLLSLDKNISIDLLNNTNLDNPLMIYRNLTEEILNESFLDGFLSIDIALVSTELQSSALTASISLEMDLNSTLLNSSTISGNLRIELDTLIAIIENLSNLSTNINIDKNLDSSISNTTFLDTFISLDKNIGSNILNNSLKSGNLKLDKNIISTLFNDDLLNADLSIDKNLELTLLNDSSITALLLVAIILNSNINNINNLSTQLKLIKNLNSTLINQTNLDSLLILEILLISNILNNSNLDNPLSLDKNITSEILNLTDLTNLLSLDKKITASIFNDSNLDNPLMIYRNLITDILNITDLSNPLSIDKNINSDILNITNLDSSLSLEQKLSAIILNQTTLTTILNLDKNITGSILNNSNLDNPLSLDKNLITSLLNTSNINGILNILRFLISSINNITTLDSILNIDKNLSTQLVNISNLTGILTVIEGIVTFTDFGDYTTGVNPDDWTVIYQSQTGLEWYVESNTGAESGTLGDQVLLLDTTNKPDTTEQYTVNSWDKIPNDTVNIMVTGLITQSGGDTANGIGLAVRASGSLGSEDFYYIEVQFQGDNLKLGKHVNGSDSTISLTSDPYISFNYNGFYYTKMVVIDNQIKIKIWGYNSTEPDYWQDIDYDSDITAGGRAGVYVETFGIDYECDSFEYEIDPAFITSHITDFSEYPTGSNPDDWEVIFDDDTAHIVWSVIDITGNNVLEADILGDVLTGNGSTNWIKQIPPDTENVRLKGRMQIGDGGDFDAVGFSIRADGDPASTQTLYRMRLTPDLSPANSIVVNRVIDGTNEQTYSAPDDITININTWYWVIFEAIGTNLRVKVWEDGTSEPATWNIDVTDSTITSGRAGVSISKFSTGANTGLFDDVSFEISSTQPAEQFFTDFSEYTTGNSPSDWESVWYANDTWTVVEEVGADGGKLLNANMANVDYRFFRWNEISPIEDVEVVTKIRFDANTGGSSGIMPVAIVRGSGSAGSEEGYYARIIYNTDTDYYEFGIMKAINGTHTGIIGTTEFTFTADTFYYVRFRVIGNDLQAKHWEEGNTEPSTFQLNTTDSDITTAGHVGIGDFSSNGERDFDIYGVGLNGDTAPIIDPST